MLDTMAVMIALLRAVNLGAHNKVPMEGLRGLCESLGLKGARTLVQSGNVVFRTAARNPDTVAVKLEDAIEGSFGFRTRVVLRTPSELRGVIAGNPFADRDAIEPGRLHVFFLAKHPDAEAHKKVLAIKTDPEELHIGGRELFIYFPNGMGRSKLSLALVEKILKVPGTARNWNTVVKLLQIAESMDN
jgi:uncharacterized protein (DUF1697 family)